MARRRSRKTAQSRKVTSTLTRLKFSFPTLANSVTPSSTQFIDIAQVLSNCSRRFYRQGYCYSVVGFEIISDSDTGTGQVFASSVPTTWFASGAWQKSYSLWQEYNDQVLDNLPDIKPRWHDFKVYLDSDHMSVQSTPGLSDGNAAARESGYTNLGGEWEYSLFQMPNDPTSGVTTEHTLHVTGANAGDSLGMIEGYGTSRAIPQNPDPNLPSAVNASWMANVFDVGENLPALTGDLESRNDNLPYDPDDYPGDASLAPYPQMMDQAVITATTIGAKTFMQGGLAYCGLLRIDNTLSGDGSNSGFDLIVHLAPGEYKGVAAVPMQDVN